MTQLDAIRATLIGTAEKSRDAVSPIALKFTMREFAGGLGDLGTFLPIAVALTVACHMNLGMILICAGLMNIITGWWFRQPIPVQPMKAIAAVAIAEGLSQGQIAAAGLCSALILLLLVLSGSIDPINRWIPKPVIRGLQLGMGMKLGWTGLLWIGHLPVIASDGWFTAAIIASLLLLTHRLRQPVLLYVFLIGLGIQVWTSPHAFTAITPNMPLWSLRLPQTTGEWWIGLTRGAIPQLPLTLLNSVVAVCALSANYFPSQAVTPRRVATSVALMNLFCIPAGGMPMCHGSGGLAAQYHFGARTGGSVILLGLANLLAGLCFGSTLLQLLATYPRSILGVMIAFAGCTLALAARDVQHSRHHKLVMVVTATGILSTNTFVGFLIGCVLNLLMNLLLQCNERPTALNTGCPGQNSCEI